MLATPSTVRFSTKISVLHFREQPEILVKLDNLVELVNLVLKVRLVLLGARDHRLDSFHHCIVVGFLIVKGVVD